MHRRGKGCRSSRCRSGICFCIVRSLLSDPLEVSASGWRLKRDIWVRDPHFGKFSKEAGAGAEAGNVQVRGQRGAASDTGGELSEPDLPEVVSGVRQGG